MKTIVFATDFSPAAKNAANYAAGMALSIHARLLILTVVPVAISFSEMPLLIGIEDVMRNADADLLKLKAGLLEEIDSSLEIATEAGMGSFFDELKNVCEREEPYLVIMGSQGTTAAEQLMFGSHAVNAMKNLAWPVITVPPVASFSLIKKIAVACDLEEIPGQAQIDEIKILAKDFDAELHVINSGKAGIFDPDIVFTSAGLEDKLKPLHPVYHFISEENTDAAIIDFADKHDIDLLVIFPKHYNFIDRLIHKSHTRELVLHSHKPVLAIHV